MSELEIKNIIPNNKLIFIRKEKDNEYRKAIIKVFSE